MLEQEDNLTLVFFNTEVLGGLEEILNLRAFSDIDLDLVNHLRVAVSDVLNSHATGRAVDEHCSASLTVQCHTEIELFFNGNLFDNVDTVAWESGVSRLLGDECVTTHLLSYLLHLIGGFHNMHSALVSILLEVSKTATAAQNLSFDDVLHLLLLTELFGNKEGFLSIKRYVT